MAEQDLLTHAQAHRYLGINRHTLTHAAFKGWIKPAKRIGDTVYYTRESLDELEQKRGYSKRRG